uniref:Uncharacterized protein n=1 Tax=Rangifer tarandus platyrhynchus TaxID=3082113 RepID=A0ACB0E8P9_RANTA|nr:unnamed protein product [Rangifer tarandus platyrhynchus]
MLGDVERGEMEQLAQARTSTWRALCGTDPGTTRCSAGPGLPPATWWSADPRPASGHLAERALAGPPR